MRILVTGGLGFIGSHTVIALLSSNHEVYIVDNLSNTRAKVLNSLNAISNKENIPFQDIDVTDENALDHLFFTQQFDGVIHFAGYKAVAESVSMPLAYYKNNVMSTILLAEACLKYGVGRFVFSSSATVYGENEVPFTEDMPLAVTTNPYGETKSMSERILKDVVATNHQFSVALLRYFNPVGAHPSGLIGESPNGVPNNLMPYISQTARGIRAKLHVFGGDYPTHDGTGVRDFIHVMDLAEGHVAAIENLQRGVHTYNLGTGKGISVLELIHTFKKINATEVPFEIVERRPGDVASSFADVTKAERELGWKATRTLEDMCRDAWRFEINSR
ncbi:UDP-glucose 4-epimerase GalE [Chryseomicrobium palamuruense]